MADVVADLLQTEGERKFCNHDGRAAELLADVVADLPAP